MKSLFNYKREVHPRLFPLDLKFKNGHEIRNHIGGFFEELSCSIFPGSRRCRTDGTKPYCPDLHWFDNQFIECKAVGLTNRCILYEGRIAKDSTFIQDNSLLYAIWQHTLKCTQTVYLSELHAGLLRHLVSLTVARFEFVRASLVGRPTRVLNTRYTNRGDRLGYGDRSKGYGIGWSLPLKVLHEQLQATPCKVGDKEVTLYSEKPL